MRPLVLPSVIALTRQYRALAPAGQLVKVPKQYQVLLAVLFEVCFVLFESFFRLFLSARAQAAST